MLFPSTIQSAFDENLELSNRVPLLQSKESFLIVRIEQSTSNGQSMTAVHKHVAD